MSSGEGGFAAPPASGPRLHAFPERRFAVRRHNGGLDSIEETRRPLYQHMIMHELVGGPPVLRFDGEGIDVMVGATCGFDGDEGVSIEVLPAGTYAVVDFEGPESELEAARGALLAWASKAASTVGETVLQVHMMDPIDGETEQQLQVAVHD